MQKPELQITSNPDDDFLEGVCSSCRQVRFRLVGNDLKHKEMLRKMFDNHFRRVHMREEASQAAAVRPGTKET
jgi:hypothetical protein